MTTVTIDRHVLASNASTYNLAWRSFGWSPGIAGPRATRLEEEVPWGTLADRAATPGWLAGRPSEILSSANLDRLQWAFLPLDGRVGLSVWGAIGDRSAPPGNRRVLTHTLIMDEQAFRLLGGYPFGLLGTERVPGGWLRCFTPPDAFTTPGGLEAIRVDVTPALTRAFETARITEVRRLRRVLLERLNGDTGGLARRLTLLYEALAGTRGRGPRPHANHVAIRDDGPAAPLIVRLAWLSLPLADRLTVWFNTEQARTERPRAHLLVLPAAEWGRSSPPGTAVLEPGDPGLPGARTEGTAAWAEVVAGKAPRDMTAAVLRRADVRGWGLLGASEAGAGVRIARLLATWRKHGPSRDVALAVARVEAGADGSRGRAGAVGVLLGRARGATRVSGDPAEAARELVDVATSTGLLETLILRGVIRGLRLSEPRQAPLAGFVRCVACLGSEDPGVLADLARLGGREAAEWDALLEHADGLAAVVLAVTATRRAGVRLEDSEGGPRLLARLRVPDLLASALAPGARIPPSAYLDLTAGDTELLAGSVDRVGPKGLGREAVEALTAVLRGDEARAALSRTWERSVGNPRARLQVLAAGDGPLDDPESRMAADALARIILRTTADGDLGGAAEVGQSVGGVVLGSPAVSPFPEGAVSIVARLSDAGLRTLLTSLTASTGHIEASVRAGVVPHILNNPVCGAISDADTLDRILRLLWAEWSPDGGSPSLGAATAAGAPLRPLLVRLYETPAPIPLRSEFRRALTGSGSAPYGAARAAHTRGWGSPDERRLFLRNGAAP